MLKELLHIEFQDKSEDGLNVHIIKKYETRTPLENSFETKNFSILLIKSGRFKLQLRETVFNLSASDLLIIPKKTVCKLLEVLDGLQFFLISFSSEYAFKNALHGELVETYYLFLGNNPIKIALEKKEFLMLILIYKLIFILNKDHVRTDFDSELRRISLNLILYEFWLVYSKYKSEGGLYFSRKESAVIKFFSILSIQCRKHHNVKFYAGALFVTPGHLNKMVKGITGKTAKRIIMEALVDEAKKLLEDLQYPIAEIAEELEFTSVSTFSNFFRKATSFSPSEYRFNSIERFKSH